MDMTLETSRKFVEVLASDAPAPGGGGAAALVGAIGTALGNMVGSLTVGKKKYADYCTMMVKTHLSLSDDPTKKGVPTGWKLTIRDILEYGGAKFLCPLAGTISMMPGTAADPAYRRVDVDVETGKVSGLF